MTLIQKIITIILCAIATLLTRFLPFLIFKENKPTPKYIQYLGQALPAAMFSLLVIYCIKDVDFLNGNHGLNEILALLATSLIHLHKRNTLLSITVGTVVYMLLLHLL